jgi:hypothetical protein
MLLKSIGRPSGAPPERNRTRLPLLNAGAAWFCIAVFDGAEAEKAGARGILSASVTATAIDACLMETDILNSILKLCGLLVTAAARATRCRSSAWSRAGRAWRAGRGEQISRVSLILSRRMAERIFSNRGKYR